MGAATRIDLSSQVQGTLPFSNLQGLSANQIVGALTATAPSGLSVPSCSGPISALTWTSGTGFACNTGARTASANCAGTATSSISNLSMSGLGFTPSGSNCAGTLGVVNGLTTTSAGTISLLTVRCANRGVNSSSGVFTVLDTPSGGVRVATGLTVTFGLATNNTSVQDTTHSFTYAAGDLLQVNFTTQAAETLGNCSVSFAY